MRVLTSLVIVAALAPLSACYVGNTPPTSRRAADAAVATADASAPAPEPPPCEPDPTPAATPQDLCAADDECGDDARCVRPNGGVARCVLNPPPPADAGPVDAGPAPCSREVLCGGRDCGRLWTSACAPVDCGACAANHTCEEGLGRCEYTGPLWALRVVSARIDRCDTGWDQCRNGGAPFCTPTLPDPFVRVNGAVTTPAGNRCEGTYNQEVGVLEEGRFVTGLDLVLEDDDSPVSNVRSGDVVCRARLTATPAELAAGTKVVTCAGGSVTVRFERRR
ncbi:MAG: hypothetical protein U0325_23190 [Polyangiales bacterium]